jgi:NAD(P) transhydrogenase subunit alpha
LSISPLSAVGNTELTEPGGIVEHNGVRIMGELNLPGTVPVNASSLYARNLQAFIEPMIDKRRRRSPLTGTTSSSKGTLIARDGAIVNAMIAERLEAKRAKPTDAAPAKAANPKRQPKGGKT